MRNVPAALAFRTNTVGAVDATAVVTAAALALVRKSRRLCIRGLLGWRDRININNGAIGSTDEQARGQYAALVRREAGSGGAGRAVDARPARLAPTAGEHGVDAHRSCAVAREEQEDEGEQQRQLTAVLD